MAKAIDVLKAHQSSEPSKWKEQAQWNVDNWGWLKHSAKIALNARKKMAALGLTQKELAEKMGCSQQYISLVLKGKENLTLDTISRLERVLDMDLLIHPGNLVSGYGYQPDRAPQYLSEPDSPVYGSKKKEE